MHARIVLVLGCALVAGHAMGVADDAIEKRLAQPLLAAQTGFNNYLRDNREAFYRMIGDLFYPDEPGFPRSEIASEGEVKSIDDLRVALPEPNENFHTLARRLSRDLPRRTWRLPAEAALARQRLSELVRAKRYDVAAEQVAQERLAGGWVRNWLLRMGDAWTVPAVEFEPAEPRGITVIVA